MGIAAPKGMVNMSLDSQLDLLTWTDAELREAYLSLVSLGCNGRLTPEDKMLLQAIIAERQSRAVERSDPH